MCDYTEADGSEFSGAAPRQNGRVQYQDGRPVCEACFDTSMTAMVELSYPEPEPEEEDTVV